MAKSIIQNEKWRDIIDYEGIYQISNLGNVKSLERIVSNNKNDGVRIVKEKILHSIDNGNGYKFVSLNKNNKHKNFYIHRLVAGAFVENPENKKYVNHKDFNKYNNNASNLEWCTQKENVNYSVERMKHPKNSKLPKYTNEKYIHFRYNKYRVCIKNLKVDKSFKTIDEAISFRNSKVVV